MKITFTLDCDDAIDPDNLLGDFLFDDENGQKESLKNIFVDSWLLSFLRCRIFNDEKYALISVIDEPFSIEAKRSDEKLNFFIRNQGFEVPVDELYSAVHTAAEALIDEVWHIPRAADSETLIEIRHLLSSCDLGGKIRKLD